MNLIYVEYENMFFNTELIIEPFIYYDIISNYFNNKNNYKELNKNNYNKLHKFIIIIFSNGKVILLAIFLYLVTTNSVSKIIPESNEFEKVMYYNPFELLNKKKIVNKSKNTEIVYKDKNNIFLLYNFHKTFIQPFRDYLIDNIILYGDFNVQRHLKSSEGQNEVNNQIGIPTRSFTGEGYRLGTGHSRSQTQYYSAYFTRSTPGSVFTPQDFNIIKKFNGDLYLWSSEKFNIFEKVTLAFGVKETLKDYHIGLTNNISLEIPLFHNKLYDQNGFDLKFIHNFRQNKEKMEAISTTTYFTLELVYNDNFILELIPNKNFVGLSFNYLAHDGIKKQVRDYAKTLNDKSYLNKKNLNYAAIQNSTISIARDQNLSDTSTKPKGIPELPSRRKVKATAKPINQQFSYFQTQRLKLAAHIVKQKNVAKLKLEQAKQILFEVIENNNFFSINNNNTQNNKTNLTIVIDILCGMVLLGFIGSLVCLSIPQLNSSIGSSVTWALTFLIVIIIRFIVNIEKVGEKVSTNTVINIINENPLIQFDLIAFGSLCIFGNIILILHLWEKYNGDDDKNNDKDFSKSTNKPPNPGGFDPSYNIESEEVKLTIAKQQNTEQKFRKPIVKARVRARNIKFFMTKIVTNIKKMRFF